MHYVQHFKINGVDTKQVACIELQGKPNAATEGCVGLLAIDVTSPLHEVYKCIAKNGNIYTWELLSSGTCIMSSTITGEGEEIAEFPYDKLKTVANYVVKVGDVIIDKEGFLYQVESINYTSCMARYNGTQIVSGVPKVGKVDNGKILSVVDGCHSFVNVRGSSVAEYVEQEHSNHQFPLVYSHTMESGVTSTTIDLTQLIIGTIYLVTFDNTYMSKVGLSSGFYVHSATGGTINFGSIHCYVKSNGTCDFKHCGTTESAEYVKGTMSFYQLGGTGETPLLYDGAVVIEKTNTDGVIV